MKGSMQRLDGCATFGALCVSVMCRANAGVRYLRRQGEGAVNWVGPSKQQRGTLGFTSCSSSQAEAAGGGQQRSSR